MQLDWRLNAQFAGLCVADAHGHYRRQGLAVTLNPAPPEMDVIQTVVSQPHTIGCAEESLILTAQANGVDVVAIATMLQASPLALMSLPDMALSNLPQLIGKRIGIHSDGQKALELLLTQNSIGPEQLDMTEIPYQGKSQRLINGEFDAVQCYALDEPVELAQHLGQEPTVLTFKDYGFDAYSQVIFAPTQLAVKHSQLIYRFLAATFAGWSWAIDNPFKTAQLLVRHYVEPDYQDIAYQTQSLKILASYIQPDGSNIGLINQERWQRSARQLARAGLIERLPAMDTSIDMSIWS